LHALPHALGVSPTRSRDSVYVREGQHRKGIGKAILAALIERSEQLGYRQLIAVIGDSAQAPSIGLHASLGFLRAGMLRSVGFKFGRWVDTVIMQRPLGSGDCNPALARFLLLDHQ
jgi:phosphinothricin acetyltransferase